MSYQLHEDERGSFQELAKLSDVKFGQLSLLTIKPNNTRGGHFHLRKKEWFLCMHGKCQIKLTDVRKGEIEHVDMSDENKEWVFVKPYISHSVTNKSDGVCELLVIVSEPYDENNKDTCESR